MREWCVVEGRRGRGRERERSGGSPTATMPSRRRFFSHCLLPTSPQYLFNAPEGYARLALEHKARPSARLRAAMVTTLATRGAVSERWEEMLAG